MTPPTPTEAEIARKEREAVVSWLNRRWGGAWELIHRQCPEIGAHHVPRVLAEAIERGDHLAVHSAIEDSNGASQHDD